MQSLSFILPMTGDFVENKKITFKEVYNEFIEKEAPATRAYATVVRYLNRLLCEGIECEYLVKPLEKDYADVVKSIEISSPVDFVNEDISDIETIAIPLSEQFLNLFHISCLLTVYPTRNAPNLIYVPSDFSLLFPDIENSRVCLPSVKLSFNIS